MVFLELGQEVSITGEIYDAINEEFVVDTSADANPQCRPLIRKNTGDNTPAIIHTDIVPSSDLRIIVAPKGAGSENSSG